MTRTITMMIEQPRIITVIVTITTITTTITIPMTITYNNVDNNNI